MKNATVKCFTLDSFIANITSSPFTEYYISYLSTMSFTDILIGK